MEQDIGFYRDSKSVHQSPGRSRQEPGRKPAGVAGEEPQKSQYSIPCIWPMYPASDHSKTQEMEHFVKEFANSPAIFITFQAHRNTCTGCSESRPRPPECKTVQRFLQLPNARYPRLQGPIRPLIIHAQAAGNLTRQLSFMHPVHSVASTGHTGDTQDLTTRPLQEISRAAHISPDQLRSAHISTAQIS